MSECWRCFVAIPLGEELREELRAAVSRLRSSNRDLEGAWRWSPPEQWHVTLAFLGDTERSAIGQICSSVRDVAAAHRPFTVGAGGLGAFPAARAARVLWYGIGDPDGLLAGLADDVRVALGMDPASLHAHVTLGRARHRHGGRVNDLLRATRMPAGSLRVDRARLYRSHRGNGPARYEVVSETPLGGIAAGA